MLDELRERIALLEHLGADLSDVRQRVRTAERLGGEAPKNIVKILKQCQRQATLEHRARVKRMRQLYASKTLQAVLGHLRMRHKDHLRFMVAVYDVYLVAERRYAAAVARPSGK